nr:PREDICTED: cation/H(+) antiporter 3-like [Daucus carota subsp. sativus]
MSSVDHADFKKQADKVRRYDELCTYDVPLNSPGLYATGFQEFLTYVLPRLELQLVLMFSLTQALHLLFKRFNFPRNFSEILVYIWIVVNRCIKQTCFLPSNFSILLSLTACAFLQTGIIIGKTLLGHIVGFEKHQLLFPDDDILLETLMKLGFIFYMFLVGVKMDPNLVPKAGKKGWSIGVSAAVCPFIVSSILGSQKLLDYYLPIYRRPAIRAIVKIIGLSPFPVIVALLIDLKIMNSELGRLALAAGLICDVLNLIQILGSTIYRIYFSEYGIPVVILTLIEALLVTIASISSHVLFLKIIQLTPEGKPVKNYYISLICSCVLVSSIACNNVGLQYHFAPFVIGLAVPSGPPLGSAIADAMDTFISGLLAPFILTYCAIKMDLVVFYDLSFLNSVLFVLSVVTASKIVGVCGVAMVIGVPIRDAVNLSIIMATQGIVQGALYESVYKLQSIDRESFTVLILSILVMALVAHLSVGFLNDYSRAYSGYQKRDIQHTPFNAELRILACADRLDDAMAVIRLLETSNPSKESPLAIYVLHLVELVGRATPVVINHRLGQKNANSHSRSHQLIGLFEKFGSQRTGFVSVQGFTAMSLPQFMHQDICSLAFDKLASLIILPFHKKWSQQGKIIFDSSLRRTINRQVLEMAPCSVGILIDRRKIRPPEASQDKEAGSVYHLGVIFLGGADDREAVAYAKRIMVKAVGCCLTVVRIVASDAVQENQWNTILDTETLREVKLQGANQHNIQYREVKSKDGPETALLINTMVEDGEFNMLMVGRRHSASSPLLTGLSEWCDLPELGSVGDILASAEIIRPVSVLVMQQQIVGRRR